MVKKAPVVVLRFEGFQLRVDKAIDLEQKPGKAR
jgi:hypothetical protein